MEKDTRICQSCKKEHDRKEMEFTYDRYGIPFQLVCENCYEKAQEKIEKWEYDANYCGECLESDY